MEVQMHIKIYNFWDYHSIKRWLHDLNCKRETKLGPNCAPSTKQMMKILIMYSTYVCTLNEFESYYML